MLPIDKIKFVETKLANGDIGITATMLWSQSCVLSRFELASRDMCKSDLRRQLWHDTYGEAMRPLNEFNHQLKRYVEPHKVEQVQEALTKLYTLLDYPAI